MSEPWIRVYPLEMRGDPKLAGVNADRQLALIHAWDIAKNGPGEVGELRAADGHAISERELRRMVGVDPNATRALFQRWAERDLCELQDEDGKVLVHFPDLARRQGIDPTNAERQRRFRERKRNAKSNGPRNAKVTVESNGAVTGQSKSREELTRDLQVGGLSEVSSSRNLVEPIWNAFAEHHPQATLTPARRELVKRRLRDFPAETLIAAVHGNHADPWCNGENPGGKTYHALELILRDADKIEKYAAIHRNGGSGAKPKKTQAEIDRLYLELVPDARRPEEGMPY